MAEIESFCKQIYVKIKKEEIYILKERKGNILHTISMQDNTTLKKI